MFRAGQGHATRVVQARRGHAQYVDRGAANPFESVPRAHCIVAGAAVVTQHEIKDKTFYAKVDIAIEEFRIVVEAESFEHHGDRPALKRDCRRYTGLARAAGSAPVHLGRGHVRA